MKRIPPAAWENGLFEAMERLAVHLEEPETKEEVAEMKAAKRGVYGRGLDARDLGALAYVLWRLQHDRDNSPAEPLQAPGKHTAEQIAQYTEKERVFFGLDPAPYLEETAVTKRKRDSY